MHLPICWHDKHEARIMTIGTMFRTFSCAALCVFAGGVGLLADETGTIVRDEPRNKEAAADMKEAEEATRELYKFVCAAHPRAEGNKEVWLGELPYAPVKPYLHSSLLAKVEKALSLDEKFGKRFPDEKPEMTEFDYFSGFPTTPKKFEIQQVRTWGDNVVIELRLKWEDNDYAPNWRQNIFVHWRREKGKMLLSEIKWPGENIENLLNSTIADYTKRLARRK